MEDLEAEVFEAESESDAESFCSDCLSIVPPEWEPVEQDEYVAPMYTEALGTHFRMSNGTCIGASFTKMSFLNYNHLVKRLHSK